MRNFKNVKQIVKNLLTENRLLADNDKTLCWEFWKRESYGSSLDNDYFYCMSYDTYKELTSESSITRARRQVEAKYEFLRGDTYYKRKCIKEPEIRNLMNEEKNNN